MGSFIDKKEYSGDLFVDVELYREYAKGNEGVQESVREILNQKQINTLVFCFEPRSSKAILDYLGITYHSKNVRLCITELVEMKLLARENPNPNDRNQNI